MKPLYLHASECVGIQRANLRRLRELAAVQALCEVLHLHYSRSRISIPRRLLQPAFRSCLSAQHIATVDRHF